MLDLAMRMALMVFVVIYLLHAKGEERQRQELEGVFGGRAVRDGREALDLPTGLFVRG
jgi:hypothetical protein